MSRHFSGRAVLVPLHPSLDAALSSPFDRHQASVSAGLPADLYFRVEGVLNIRHHSTGTFFSIPSPSQSICVCDWHNKQQTKLLPLIQ